MKKTDIVVLLSFLTYEGSLFGVLAQGAVRHNVLVWVAIIAGLIKGAAYFGYEFLTGTTPPPTPPQA